MSSWGGGEEILFNIVKNLDSYDFTLLSAAGEAYDFFKKNNLNVLKSEYLIKYYKPDNSWNIFIAFKVLASLFYSFFEISSVIYKIKPNIILANGNFAALYSLLPSKLMKKKLMVIQHMIYDISSLEHKIMLFVNKFASKVVCVSKSVFTNQLVRNEKKKYVIIPNSVFIEMPDDIFTIDYSEDKTIRFGMVGTIKELKGLHLVLEAFNEIFKRNKKCHLYIFGKTEDDNQSVIYLKKLKDYVKKNELSDYVHFEGYINEKKKIYSKFDILISYSLIPESSSLTVLEAMSFGKIVIAANCGGPAEIISNGENGFLISPNDLQELINILNYCIVNYNSENFKSIKLNAIKSISKNYSQEAFINNYDNIFQELIQN